MSKALDPLATLEEACRPALPAWVHQAPARSVVGVACTYAPLELLHAAGLTPLRLHTPGPPAPEAEAWLPPFTCAIVRGILGAALSGELEALAGFVLPHTCDSIQELSGIWRLLRPEQWLLTLVEPLAVASPRAPAYLRQELRALAARLEQELGRRISDEALSGSTALYNRLRRARRRIDGLRNRLSAAEAWAALAAAWRLPPAAYLDLAERLAAELDQATPRPLRGPALILAGSLLDEPLIPGLIDALAGRVVGDDLCNGLRGAELDAAETGDPWSALADLMLRRPACPAKHVADAPYESRLPELAERRAAQGVIQVLVRYCDPHGFATVPAGRALAASGRAYLPLEVEATNPPEQLRTRLQAFMEMLAVQT